MQKVKVQRYVAGKRPKYAGEESESEQEISEGSDNEDSRVNESKHYHPNDELIRANAADDRRLKRLTELDKEPRNRERPARHRQIAEPEVLMEESIEESIEETEMEASRPKDESEEEEEEVDADARAARRLELKKKALQRQEVRF